MAGGGVGEAMLIGAAVGAGTGGIMSAAQDKDVGQGMLLGALGGAATGGIGSGIGGALGSSAESAVAPELVQAAGTEAAAATDGSVMSADLFKNIPSDQYQNIIDQASVSNMSPADVNSTLAQTNASLTPQTWGQQGLGQGIAPGMTNAQVAGASTAGGITGLAAANGMPAPYQAPQTETYNGPLSKFKLAGPQLSQYNYNPSSFQPSVAPGYAEGGIASLAQGGVQQTGMFPQSQIDRMQFATPSQMPVSREIIGSDYDATINPYTGDLPRFAEGGGINFIKNIQPGGEVGSIASDLYGVVQEHEPGFLKDIQPGGFMGALVPGKLGYEEKKRKEEEQRAADDRAAQEEKAAAMYNQMAQQGGKMARGGIADLGSYSDGGRLLRGPGDGMSDNIPASIAGKQPARLADGEFVVPADVVSHLGNGSTDAGAKTLYSMMDKVRKARTGSKKQGREINPDKYVPGMAKGGIATLAKGGEVKRYASGNLVVQNGQIGTYNENGDFEALNSSQASNLTPQAPASSYAPSVYNPTSNTNYTGSHFDAAKYLEMYPDVAKGWAGTPLEHYQQYGQAEGRQYPMTQSGTPIVDKPSYSEYTIANRPSSAESQFYGNIYRGESTDFSTPGYTLTGGNLGRWNNVAGEARRAARLPSINQMVTQDYLLGTGRAPTTEELNQGLTRATQFNEESYLANKLKQLEGTSQKGQFQNAQQLKDFMAQVGMTPQEHYYRYGRSEGVNPYDIKSNLSYIGQSPESSAVGSRFDEAQYLQNKMQQLQGTSQAKDFQNTQQLKDYMAQRGMTPWQHYQQWGADEGVSPYKTNVTPGTTGQEFGKGIVLPESNPGAVLAFNQNQYLRANPDVANAISSGAYTGNALNHYVNWGQQENRPIYQSTYSSSEATPKEEIKPKVEGKRRGGIASLARR